MKMQFKGNFNWKAVTRSVADTATRRMKRVGYRLMKKAQGLIREKPNRNQASQKGKPPYSHGYFKKSILYGVENNGRTVVVGPAYFKGNPLTNAGRLHEFGGVKAIKGRRRQYAIGKVGPIDLRPGYTTPPPKEGRIRKPETGVAFTRLKTGEQVRRARDIDRAHWADADQTKTARYAARPYMAVALSKMTPQLTGLWVHAVTA